ncbi:MAG TPA: VOC family protein [Noviherbaspirillum sp.]
MNLPHPSFATLGPIMQLAFVPQDFDAALRYWTEHVGAGPFFMLDHVKVEGAKYKGAPTDIDFSMALGYWGDMQIELIRQHNDAPSIYKAWSDAGKEGIHHVCIVVDDLQQARAVSDRAGATIVQEGNVPGGGVIYVDPGKQAGMLIELVKLPQEVLRGFAWMREQAKGWDGRDPIRRLG